MCALTMGGKAHPIIGIGRCIVASVSLWKRVAGWVSRALLVLIVLFEIELWLDALLFNAAEYERLIGSEAACGKFASYCSWNAFFLANLPMSILAVAAIVALLWRALPRREAVLVGLSLAFFTYLFLRFSTAQTMLCVEAGPFS